MIRLSHALLLVVISFTALAQTAPSLTSAGSTFTLSVPYFEYGAGSSKLALGATFTSTTLPNFLLSPSSVKTPSVLASPGSAATIASVTGGYRLTLPYLEFTSGGITSAYSGTFSTTDLSTFIADVNSFKAVTLLPTLSAPGGVTLAEVSKQTVGSATFGSSSKLQATWTAPSGYTVDHYEISAIESLMKTSVIVTAAASATSATLTTLKAATSYSVVAKACKDSSCSNAGIAAAVSATTPGEYWQLQGTGNGYANVTKAVSDGNVLSWVMRWGSEAGSLAGRYEYFYKTTSTGRVGVAIATTTGSGTDVATMSSFVADTTLGLRNPCTPPSFSDCSSSNSGAVEISALQAIPMAASKTIRLYMNAESVKETGVPSRIYSLDARDGLVGQKFTSSSSKTYCGGTVGSTDYASGGDCALTSVLGISGDSKVPSPLRQTRQFKIGYPTLDSWLWSGASGTYMVITGDDACGKYSNALFYAVYDGSSWTVQTDSAGCAKALVPKAHGPVLVHLGSSQYKLYYEDATNGNSGKPLRLIYANGASSGTSSVDFDDWESSSYGRDVNFLWPDGTPLDAQDESGLGDHMIVTGDSLATQTMFHNLGGMDNTKWATGSAGLGISRLLNP